jgi:hypothetical protein
MTIRFSLSLTPTLAFMLCTLAGGNIQIAQAANLTSLGYSQDFDSMGTTGTTPLPIGRSILVIVVPQTPLGVTRFLGMGRTALRRWL